MDPNPNAPNGVFYQLAGRRINWDLTDYHPLLAQRARSTDTFTDGPAAVGRLSAGDRDPRGAGSQLPHHPVRRRRAGRGGRAGDLQPFDRAVPGGSHGGDVPAFGADHRSGGDRQGRHGGGLPLAVFAAERRDPGVLRRRRHRSGRPGAALRAGGRQRADGRAAACWPGDGSLSYVEAALGYKRGEHLLFSNLPAAGVRRAHGRSAPATASCTCRTRPVLATLLGANLRQPAQRRGHGSRGRAPGLGGDAARRARAPPPAAIAIGKASFESDHSLKVFLPARQAADPRVHRR